MYGSRLHAIVDQFVCSSAGPSLPSRLIHVAYDACRVELYVLIYIGVHASWICLVEMNLFVSESTHRLLHHRINVSSCVGIAS